MDEFERARTKNARLKKHYQWQSWIAPRMLFWGLLLILGLSVLMIGAEFVQSLATNNNTLLQTNLLLAPIILTHFCWLLLARYSNRSLPIPALATGIGLLLFLPILSALLSGPASWEFYMISYIFTLFTIIVGAIAHFGLRAESQFSDR